MKRSRMLSFTLSAVALVFLSAGVPALAVQYSSLDPGYTQEIYTGPLVGGPGMAWTSTNQLLTRNGSDILEYSFAQNAIHQGTSIHSSIATHSIAGLATSGYGMTNGLDGYVYTITGSGLQRFNPLNWAAPAQTLAGTITGGQGYGITTLPDGRIAYSDGIGGASSVWIYDPVATTNTLIHSGNSLIDGMVAGPTGNIAVTGQDNSTITILSNTGTVINTFSTFHFPDGLAFSAVPGSTSLYSNNNDGTITRYDLGPGFLGTPTYTDIATGSGAYGDLASVGPDCAFYVSQFDNFGFHGSTPGIGTHWDNGTTNNEPSIIRIGGVPAPDGSEVCLFYTPFEHDIPEPASVVLMSFGVVALAGVAYRRRRSVRV